MTIKAYYANHGIHYTLKCIYDTDYVKSKKTATLFMKKKKKFK